MRERKRKKQRAQTADVLFNRVKGSLVTNTKGATSHWSQLLFSLEAREREKEKERKKTQYLFFRFSLLWLDFYLALGMKLYLVVWVAMVTLYWNLQPLPPSQMRCQATSTHPHPHPDTRIATVYGWRVSVYVREKRNNCLESTLHLCVIRLRYMSKVWRTDKTDMRLSVYTWEMYHFFLPSLLSLLLRPL